MRGISRFYLTLLKYLYHQKDTQRLQRFIQFIELNKQILEHLAKKDVTAQLVYQILEQTISDIKHLEETEGKLIQSRLETHCTRLFKLISLNTSIISSKT